MGSRICFYNGQFLKKEEIFFSIDDLGFSRGYALFEHCRTYNRKLFHLEEHLIRLKNSADALFMPIPYSFEELELILKKLTDLNPEEELGFKIYLTLGCAQMGLTVTTPCTFLIYPYGLTSYKPYDFSKGFHVCTTVYSRAFPQHKTTFYLPGILAKKENEGVDEILFLDESSHILESTIASFCGFKNKALIIPQGKLLKSVTQELIAQLASGYTDVIRKSISYDEALSLDEAFLSSSTKEFIPIQSIDGHFLKPTDQFKETLKLREHLEKYICAKQWPLIKTFSPLEKETLFDVIV